MLTRAHYANTSLEVEAVINRLAARGEYIYEVVNLGHKWLVLTTRPDPNQVEYRCQGDPSKMAAALTEFRAEVEKPDTRGGASRPIDEEVIAQAVARWDDPA